MVTYRKLAIEDVEAVTEIHLVSFHQFFLSSLGGSFLQIYYKAVLRHPMSVCVGGFEGERLVGFCVGTTLSKNFHKNLLKKNFMSFLKSLFVVGITKPKAIFRLIHNMEKKTSVIKDDGNYAELLSIAVLPDIASHGVGSGLLHRFEEMLIVNKIELVALTTDFYNNDAVIHFYEKNGFNVYYEFEAYPNRKMYKMIKTFFN